MNRRMSQLERDIIKSRVIAGINTARAKGKTLGRPKRRNDIQIKRLREQGLSYRTISKKLNISLGSVQQALK